MLTKDVMAGIAHELSFWKEFVQTPRFLDGWVADIKTPELTPDIYEWLIKLPRQRILKVLDVGSGVVSILNGTFPKENITTVDPLGSLYPIIFDYQKYGIAPPIGCGGEEMDFENVFDIVHMSNAIDHSQDPGGCFRKLMAAARPGGIVVVQGFENEAISEDWQGFHQWNFTMNAESGEVTYSGRDGKPIPLRGNQVFSRYLPNHHGDRAWFISVWQKRDQPAVTGPRQGAFIGGGCGA